MLMENIDKHLEAVQEVQTTPIKRSDKCIIMGFAPDTRNLAPLDDLSYDVFGINELYLEMPILEARATAWFQLHGYEPTKVRDPNHKERLQRLRCPVFMWKQHRDIPNSVEYPLGDILRHFDIYGEGMAPDIPHERDRAYFTNTISWMIALAIAMEYKEIHVYGVNMAQDQEYQHQRPSCEFFLGWARGAGIKIYLPIQSDLLQSWMLYGYDDGSAMYQKLYAREQELEGRIQAVRNDMLTFSNNAQSAKDALNQLQGAQEDVRYMIHLGPRGVDSDLRSDKTTVKAD